MGSERTDLARDLNNDAMGPDGAYEARERQRERFETWWADRAVQSLAGGSPMWAKDAAWMAWQAAKTPSTEALERLANDWEALTTHGGNISRPVKECLKQCVEELRAALRKS